MGYHVLGWGPHQRVEGLVFGQQDSTQDAVPLAVSPDWGAQAQQQQGPEWGLHGSQEPMAWQDGMSTHTKVEGEMSVDRTGGCSGARKKRRKQGKWSERMGKGEGEMEGK